MKSLDDLLNKGEFAGRHLGSDEATQRQMLDALKVQSLDALVREVVPAGILLGEPLALGEAMREPEALAELSAHAMRNDVWRSFIGMGYHGTHTPAVIQRNVLENPGWYTAYTPYQAEISQGRLEGLLNFQQMVIDLTGLPVANASLLDEATAAAEAMAMIRRSAKSKAAAFFVDSAVHPQVLSVMRTRAKWLGIELVVGGAGGPAGHRPAPPRQSLRRLPAARRRPPRPQRRRHPDCDRHRDRWHDDHADGRGARAVRRARALSSRVARYAGRARVRAHPRGSRNWRR